jgi:hypothetical protein
VPSMAIAVSVLLAKIVRQPPRLASAAMKRRCAGSSSTSISILTPLGVATRPILFLKWPIQNPALAQTGKDPIKHRKNDALVEMDR